MQPPPDWRRNRLELAYREPPDDDEEFEEEDEEDEDGGYEEPPDEDAREPRARPAPSVPFSPERYWRASRSAPTSPSRPL